MKNYKARGIVLHTVKYGESSVVLYMLTDLLGRQTYIVQGVRGKKSKGNKAALYQPMFVLDIVGLESAKMEMHRIREARAGLLLRSIPFDIRKSTISLFMAEVLYRLAREIEPQSPLFDFVLSSVEALDNIEEGVSNFHLWFLVRLSFYLGFHPGNEYTPGSWFDIREGLFTPIMPQHRVMMDREESLLFDRLLNIQVSGLNDIKMSREQRNRFMTAILTYFGYHLDSADQIRSVQILRDVF